MGAILPYEYGKGTKPAAWWAGRIGNVVKSLFSSDGTQELPVIRNSMSSTTTSVPNVYSGTQPMFDIWRTYQDRKNIFMDIRRIVNEDDVAATALDITADCAVDYSDRETENIVAIKTENEQVKEVLDACYKRLNLNEETWQIIRSMLEQGNEFREVLIDRTARPMAVAKLKPTLSYQIWPKTNDKGDKVPGWRIITEVDIHSNAGQELEEWQIAPFFFGQKIGNLVVPMLSSSRKNWLRLSKMEDAMAIARLTRAYDKHVHHVPIQSSWTAQQIIAAIQRYKDSITKRKISNSEGLVTPVDNPLDVQTDYYVPDDGTGKGKIESLSGGNNQLTNLTDVYYHREKLLTRLQVPLGYLQIVTSMKTHMASGAGGKGDVEKQFARHLKRVQRAFLTGLRRVFDIELLLHGINPAVDTYELEMTHIRVDDLAEDAKITLTYAQAAVYFAEAFGALPPAFIAERFMLMTDTQKKIMDAFLEADAKDIWKFKLESIENSAKAIAAKATMGVGGNSPLGETKLKDRIVGGDSGSGNQNKSRGERTSEQVGGSTGLQSISVGDFTDLIAFVQDGYGDWLRNNGHDIEPLDRRQKAGILQSVLDRMTNDEV